MRSSFWPLIALLIFSRICDFYSTSLWFFQPDGMKGETNPLTRFFGFGWWGLITVNVILIGIIIWSYYYYVFNYQPVKFENPPNEFKAYVSRLYYGDDNSFNKIFYSLPQNRKVSSAHFGYVLIRLVIIASFLATIHNLCQYYNVGIYNTFRNIVVRPSYVIYGIIFMFLIYFQYKVLQIEFINR